MYESKSKLINLSQDHHNNDSSKSNYVYIFVYKLRQNKCTTPWTVGRLEVIRRLQSISCFRPEIGFDNYHSMDKSFSLQAGRVVK